MRLITLIFSLMFSACGFIENRSIIQKTTKNLDVEVAQLIQSEQLKWTSVKRHLVIKNSPQLDEEFLKTQGQILSISMKSQVIFLKVQKLFLDSKTAFASLKSGSAQIKLKSVINYDDKHLK